MKHVLADQDFDTAEAFVDALNKARLANPQQWLVYAGRVAGRAVELKSFGNGDLQILRVNGRDVRRNEYGMNVGQWKAEIVERIKLACAA